MMEGLILLLTVGVSALLVGGAIGYSVGWRGGYLYK